MAYDLAHPDPFSTDPTGTLPTGLVVRVLNEYREQYGQYYKVYRSVDAETFEAKGDLPEVTIRPGHWLVPLDRDLTTEDAQKGYISGPEHDTTEFWFRGDFECMPLIALTPTTVERVQHLTKQAMVTVVMSGSYHTASGRDTN